jgi:putative membrane protein
MIEYDKREWTSHLFDLEGSMVREILGRVTVCVAWAAAIVALHQLTPLRISISPTVHTLVGVALGLLLVFRTNASYDRYWEGRRQWGAIINESRNLARGVRAYVLPAAPGPSRRVLEWTSAFPFAAMNILRPKLQTGPVLGPATDRLPASEVAAVVEAPHTPLAIAVRITAHLAEARDRGAISDIVLGLLDGNVQQLIDYLGACERIHKTPLPFVYVVHLRRALILYCFTLPFALVELYGWSTIIVALLISYVFFGIEEIGVEIEDPFGDDPNDLPLENFCAMIARDVLETPPVPPPLPVSTDGPPAAAPARL